MSHLLGACGEDTGEGAPIYIEVEAEDRRATIRLPVEIAQQIRDVLEPTGKG
jgi:hypothetical protein